MIQISPKQTEQQKANFETLEQLKDPRNRLAFLLGEIGLSHRNVKKEATGILTISLVQEKNKQMNLSEFLHAVSHHTGLQIVTNEEMFSLIGRDNKDTALLNRIADDLVSEVASRGITPTTAVVCL